MCRENIRYQRFRDYHLKNFVCALRRSSRIRVLSSCFDRRFHRRPIVMLRGRFHCSKKYFILCIHIVNYQVKAVDENEQLTPLGKKLSGLPVDVRIGKMLLYGVALKCIDAICVIAACLSTVTSPFAKGFNQEDAVKRAKRKFFTRMLTFNCL